MCALFQPCPEPRTELGRFRILSSTAGARVSPLALGGMSFGKELASFRGAMDEDQVFKLLDAYSNAGGNFVDTSSNYQNEESEQFIGKWMKAKGNRDTMFVATKFTYNYRMHELGTWKTVNYSGNSRKCLHLSVQDSLRKLQTDYIDLLYVHFWDWTTSIEELMDSLHILVEQGKVLYLGVSDTPAWIVSAANVYARNHGKTPFSVYQGRWNVLNRDFERDIIPMARHFGMALCVWDAIGGGKFQTAKQIEAKKQIGEGIHSIFGTEQTEDDKKASEALEKVAEQHGTASIQQIALAYVMQKARNVFPVIGGRKVEHLLDNIKALSIHLTNEQIKYLDNIKEFDIGFPLNIIGDDPRETGFSQSLMTFAPLAFQSAPKPVGHA